MNISNIIHVVCALAVQAAIGLLTDNWWAGAAAGAFMFVGREYTQAAYRMAAAGVRGGYLDPLRPRWWNMDSVLDVVLPAAAVVAVAFFMR